MTDGSGGEWPSERDESPVDGADTEPGDTSTGGDPAESSLTDETQNTSLPDGTDDTPPEEESDAIPLGNEPGPAVVLEYTTDRRSLAPTVQIQWAIRIFIGILVLSSIAGFVISTIGMDPIYSSIVLGTLLVLGTTWVVLAYRRWVYQVREDALYLERGVLTHVRTLVPYVRIQHVDTSQSPVERALGLSTLVVYTAGSRGADVSIPGLRPDEARQLQRRVKELAIEAEGGDAL